MRAFIAALLAATALASSSAGGYDYKKGGEDWKTVYSSKANNICGLESSKEQSPIDLQDGTSSEKVSIKLEGLKQMAKAAKASGDHMETNWQFSFKDATWLSDAKFMRTGNDGTELTFQPAQYHFHTPSEHTVEGASFDAEMHLVTYDATNGYAVLGVFFDMTKGGSDDNEFLKSFFEGWSDRGNADAETKKTVDVTKLFSSSLEMGNFWMYDGSFTTPPCTEGVKWTVLQQVQPISAAQLAKFAQFTKGTAEGEELQVTTTTLQKDVQTNTANAYSAAGNNRKIQLLNDRVIYSHLNHAHDGASSLMATAAAIAALTALAF